MRSPRVGAAAALALLALLAGCGGDDSGSDSSASRADSSSDTSSDSSADVSSDSSASADSSDDGGSSAGDATGEEFAQQPAANIADAAKEDMLGLDAVRYSGALSSGGSDVGLDMRASSSGDCQGTVTLGQGSAEVASQDGTSWFRPDEAFWRQQVPDTADQIIAAVGDKWVLDTDNQFTQFCDLDEFFSGIFTDDSADEQYDVKGTDQLDDQDVVAVDNTSADGGTATAYILLDDPHYVLKVEKTAGDDQGAVEFSEFDEDFDVDAPTPDEVADLSQLG
ncbi:hypothetical protein G5V58_21435 [Nocardioides anomalus]|uniref:LppX_LprAFG lipoprotein n=1 Tax=Nocardioides anomalus TaxID=2712223 RepID=A0A6G6WIU9_9ACTN|nr:hypothetical protein [Nocardioides anomalus]QIG44990.1 hypothetical protein G5V58_21435 [Nocardioides anomalus]